MAKPQGKVPAPRGETAKPQDKVNERLAKETKTWGETAKPQGKVNERLTKGTKTRGEVTKTRGKMTKTYICSIFHCP